jgi:peptidoglycan/xylan/chitin deacetylase (PgdA/CDA1 family)
MPHSKLAYVVVKCSIRRLAATSPVLRALQRFTAPQVTILTLHRFATPDAEVNGHSADELRRTLEDLRRLKITLASLEDVVAMMNSGDPLERSILVFTVDDGYFDFMATAAPVFEEYDCPVTVFLTTGFIDGEVWMWWDQIAWLMEQSGNCVHQMDAACSPAAVCSELANAPFSELRAVVEMLAEGVAGGLPKTAPARYAPMTWSEITDLERRGFTFGPHTVNHPNLLRVPDQVSKIEITESWNRLCTMLQHPLPVFAYPNGAYRPREVETLRRLGLLAAVTVNPGYAAVRLETSRFELPRFPYPDNRDALLLTAVGFRLLQRKCLDAGAQH